MLKKVFKRLIIGVALIFILLCPVFSDEPKTQQVDDADFVIKPGYSFTNLINRDPFVPKYKRTEELNVVAKVNISALSLVGITRSNGEKAALFKSTIGDAFGYIFINGVFYGSNDTVIEGISGEIKNDSEVILMQGDKEIVFTLNNDTVTDYNIRPDREAEPAAQGTGEIQKIIK
jgi:hypothetical protein